jgi:hypothetical protein
MRRTIRLIVTALTGAVLLTGCSGGIRLPFLPPPLEERPPDEVLTAATERMGTETFRVEYAMDLTFSETSSGESVTVSTSAEGVLDSANQRGEMTMTIPNPNEQGAASELRMILDGDSAYFQATGSDAEQLGVEAGQWLRDDAADQSGVSANWPTDLISDGVPEAITVVGLDEVHGDTTVHYEFEITPQELLAETGASGLTDEEVQALADATQGTVPMGIWVDEQARVRKSTVDAVFDMADVGFGMEMHVSVDTREFGVDVAVEPPPADQVVDLPDAQGAGTEPGVPGLTEPPAPVGTPDQPTGPAAGSSDLVPACELLTPAEIEAATGTAVEIDELNGDICYYPIVGSSGLATETVVELNVRRYPSGVSPEDYQAFIESRVGIVTGIWTDVTRQPVDGLGQAAEVLTYDLGAVVLTYVGDATIYLDVKLEDSDQARAIALALAEIVVQRLS